MHSYILILLINLGRLWVLAQASEPSTTMKAAIYREFGGDIHIQDVPVPACPPQDGVLIRVKATGVCRSDWHGWRGHDSDILDHGLPFCPGHEVSGVVVESTSDSFQAGDRVAVPFILSCGKCTSCYRGKPTVCRDQRQPGFTQWGSYAQYLALPRASRNLRILPQEVSFLQAAALGCRLTTAYRAVLQQGQLVNDDDANSQETKSMAVFGCGGLGLSCILLASGKASPIIAVDVSQKALEKARELGATHTILASRTNSDEVRKQIWDLTDNEGADLTLDAAGFPATCENAVYCTRRGGRMVQVGLPIGGRPPEVPMGLVAGRELELIGSHGFAADDLPDLLELVAKGKLDPSVLVERCVTLKEGAEILMKMDTESPTGMAVITDFE